MCNGDDSLRAARTVMGSTSAPFRRGFSADPVGDPVTGKVHQIFGQTLYTFVVVSSNPYSISRFLAGI